MRIEPVHIPEDLATQVDNTEDLTKLVLTWNAFDIESLTEYFEQGGRPYIKFPNRLIRELSQAYAVMTVDFIGQSAQREFIVPLPSLTVRQHFVGNDGTPDMKAIENYSTMLDMCLEHGLSIDACDSVGLTMLGSSLLHLSVFCKLLPNNIDWRNARVSYSPNLFDYSVAGILLSRGADPFKRANGQNFTNILSQAADGACKASDCLAHARSSRINPGIWSWTTDNGINLFYADVLSHICENAPYFEKSPFPVREQWNIVTRLITAGFIQLAESDYVIDLDADNSFDTDIDKFNFVPILESLLKRNVLTVEALEPDCGGDSALYSLSKMTGCMLSNAAFAALLPRPAGDPRTQYRYNAIKRHSQHILTTLLRYGADIDHIEYSGRLSVVGLVRVPGNNGSVKRFPKEFYDYLLDFESILLQNGWNHTLKDKYNKTIFDYYPNKQEGLRARRTMDEAARQLESEEAAYAAMDEEFMR